MSQELEEKLRDLVDVMDSVMFEEDACIEDLAPELIVRYCALKGVLAREAVTTLRNYMSAN